jgi:Tfp pilus assembly protein PilF
MSSDKKNRPLYRCVSCEETFRIKPNKKPRCPHCMSIHSVEPVMDKGAIALPAWSRYLLVGVVVIGAAVAAVYLFLHFRSTPSPMTLDPESLGAVDSQRLERHLEEKGLEPDNVIRPFASSEALDEFADEHEGFGGAQKRAESLYGALLELKSDGKLDPYIPRQPRKSDVMTAGELYDAVAAGEEPEAYSLELALMLAAAARSAGAPAVVAEVVDYPGLKAPLDPSGNFGHFGVAVYEDGSYEGSYVLYDLHRGRTLPGDQAQAQPLTDTQVVAHVLGHRAVKQVAVDFDAQSALLSIEDAMLLHPDAVQLHTLRALVYVSSGGIEEGRQELRKAMQLRTDAQRLVKHGALLLADEEEEEAQEQIQKAIDLKPEYALAHASLAMALLADGEVEEARRALDMARELDPEDPLIAVYETNYWMAVQDVDRAMKAAETAWERNYHDPQTGLLLAAIYGKAGKEEKMRAVLQEIRKYEDLPQEIIDLIDSQLGEITVAVEGEDEDAGDEELDEIDEEIVKLLEEDDEADGDLAPELEKPGIGEKPREGFLTGGRRPGVGLTPGPGVSPGGLSLGKGGGLLSGGD